MIIDNDILEKTCKDMIETILYCLPNASKGTVYLVGPMPRLHVIRVTSGVRREDTGEIQWGLPEDSGYNVPGKSWEDYRDLPGRALEAMAWCVERQKSWTADDPHEDRRSVTRQLHGLAEDFHHMEPVLVKKCDLYKDNVEEPEYPLDFQGNPIWMDCNYVVVAVVKIHFKPHSIQRGDPSTKIIKKLSRTLGTELISLHIRETLAEEQKSLARQRLQSCNVLAHDLRNTLIKLGFIFSAISVEIGYLREQWEAELERALPHIASKRVILERLNDLIRSRLSGNNGLLPSAELGRKLLAEQQELAELPLLPEMVSNWLENRIRPKWQQLLVESDTWQESQEEVSDLLEKLERWIWLGSDKAIADQIVHLPEDLRALWPRIAYVDFNVDELTVLEDILQLLNHPDLKIPHKYQSKRILTALKALAEIIPEIEERANRIMLSLRNGSTSKSPRL